MANIIKKIAEKIKDFLVKKSFWIYNSQAKLIEVEAKKNWGDNQSELMREIISNWFEK